MSQTYKDHIKLLIAWGLVLLALVNLSSCTAIHKVFDKKKSSSDSVAVSHVAIDSVASKDSVHVKKIDKEAEGEIEIQFSDSIGGQSYFEVTPEGIKTNRPVKSIKLKGKMASHSIDSVSKQEAVQVKKVEDKRTEVKKKDKEVTREVKKTRFPWWILWLLLAIIIAYLAYRNRAKIKAWVLTIVP